MSKTQLPQQTQLFVLNFIQNHELESLLTEMDDIFHFSLSSIDYDKTQPHERSNYSYTYRTLKQFLQTIYQAKN